MVVVTPASLVSGQGPGDQLGARGIRHRAKPPACPNGPAIALHHGRLKTIQIRNVPDDVHRVLRSRASAAGMSLSDYLLREVSRLAARSPVADVLLAVAARPGGAPSDAILEAVRDARR